MPHVPPLMSPHSTTPSLPTEACSPAPPTDRHRINGAEFAVSCPSRTLDTRPLG